jgi:hypothetical protein
MADDAANSGRRADAVEAHGWHTFESANAPPSVFTVEERAAEDEIEDAHVQACWALCRHLSGVKRQNERKVRRAVQVSLGFANSTGAKAIARATPLPSVNSDLRMGGGAWRR